MAVKKSKLIGLIPVDENIEPPKKSLKQIAASLKRNSEFAKHNDIQSGSEIKSPEVIPTGILALDYALSIGGFPRGKIVQLYGNESSWKSTICLRTIAEAQKSGGTAVWFDAERSFDPSWAKANGVVMSDDQFLLIKPDTAENALDSIEEMAREGVTIVVLDSIAALAPHKEKYSDENKRELQPLDKEQMGVFAKIMSKFFRRAMGTFAKSGTLFLVVNQLRSSLSPYGSPTSVPGGKALKHANSISINMKRLTAEKDRVYDSQKNVIGSKYEFTIDKTRYGVIGKSGGFTVVGTKIDNVLTLRDIAIQSGIIEKINASNYMLNGEKINGANNVAVKLLENPELAKEIELKIRAKMGFNVVEDAKSGFSGFDEEILTDEEKEALEREEENPDLDEDTDNS